MTTTHDTAAALEAATLALIEAAAEEGKAWGLHSLPTGDDSTYADYSRANEARGNAEDDVKAAITAHVEAEVARRLAAAPDVEQWLGGIVSRALRGCSGNGARADLMAEVDRLRAAIAADKARAVADARRVGFKAGSAERSPVHDAIGVSPQDAARAAMAHGVPCPTCGSEARPTPDEARRLVEVYGRAVDRLASLDPRPTAGEVARLSDEHNTTRAALLRALGVEP